MKSKQYGLMVILALIAGLIGGMVSSQLFTGKPVFAQKKSIPQKAVAAEEFLLVDKDGNLRASFGDLPNKGLGLTVLGKNANIRLLLGVNDNGEPGLWLYNKDGIPCAFLASYANIEVLQLGNKLDGPSLSLGLMDNKIPIITFWDENSNKRAFLVLAPNEDAIFVIYDRNGSVIWSAP